MGPDGAVVPITKPQCCSSSLNDAVHRASRGIAGERQAACPNLANELARERNREAAERTLMAWIRTALSLIGFGFGIGKLDAYLQGAGLHTRFDLPHSTLIFGASFIVVEILGLLAAIVQHSRVLKRLSRPDFAYNAMRPIAMTVAALLILIGVFGLIAILW